MVFSPNLCACPVKCGADFSGVMLKVRDLRLDLEQKSSFMDEHCLIEGSVSFPSKSLNISLQLAESTHRRAEWMIFF
jgi:hypothetical protein